MFDLPWASPEGKEVSSTADGPHLAQMYFHLLIRNIYFSFHVFSLCVLDIGKNAVSEPKIKCDGIM